MTKETWMYSKDDECYFGGEATKIDAIKAGRQDFADGDPFTVARVRRRKYSTDIFDDISEAFDDTNCEESGEDYASSKWSKDDHKEIPAILSKAFSEWLKSKGYLEAYALDILETEEVPATEEFQIWEETGKWPEHGVKQ